MAIPNSDLSLGSDPLWGKIIDQTRCIGCHACTTACKSENEVPLSVTRTFVKYVDVGTFPTARRAFQVTRCNQCEDPPCVAAVGTLAARIQSQARECDERLASLGLWTGTLDDLARTPVPSSAALDRAEKELADAARAVERAEEARDTAAADIRTADESLRMLAGGASIPSEAELDAERDRRNQGWKLIRSQYLDGDAERPEEVRAFARDKPIAEAYEESVETADRTADALRLHADRVQAQVDLKAKRANADERLASATAAIASATAERDAAWARWRGAWQACAIEPRTPAEMRSWLADRSDLLASRRSLVELEAEVSRLERDRTSHRARIDEELRALAETAPESAKDLATWISAAQGILDAVARASGERESAEKNLAAADERIEVLENVVATTTEKVQQWRARWDREVGELGLSADDPPSSALDAIDALAAVFHAVEQVDESQRRVTAMEADLEGFESELAEIVQAHVPDLAGQPPERSAHGLTQLLGEADAAEASHRELTLALETEDENLRVARQSIADAEAAFATLRTEAGCDDDAGLRPALERWREAEQLDERIRKLERQLVEAGDGASIDDLLAESEGVDPAALDAERDGLAEAIQDLEARRHAVVDRRADARAALEHLDGSAAVARAEQEAQSRLAALRDEVERYVDLRLAHAILEREVERHGERHRAPRIERTEAIFREITCGAYHSLQSRVGDDDRPYLRAVRTHDQCSVDVAGMSSGTRDQLYLALRIATLEEALVGTEPMPFIVDDILVNFDDDRAAATLAALADLAQRTQVILFTHHSRTRDQALALGERASVVALERETP